MQRQIITIPKRLWSLIEISWEIDWRSQTSGGFNDGTTGIYFDGFPQWIGSSKTLTERQDIGVWRAMRAASQGRVGRFLVPMNDPAVFPINALGASRDTIKKGKLSVEGNYSDAGNGTLYEPFCTVAADYAVGVEEITLDMSAANGFVPRQGQIMSTPNYLPFAITWVLPEGGSVYRVGIQMPLREALATGDIILLRGKGLFELMEDTTGATKYGGGQYATPTLSLVEVLAR